MGAYSEAELQRMCARAKDQGAIAKAMCQDCQDIRRDAQAMREEMWRTQMRMAEIQERLLIQQEDLATRRLHR